MPKYIFITERRKFTVKRVVNYYEINEILNKNLG